MPPRVAPVSDWQLTVDGTVEEPLELSVSELQCYPVHHLSVVLECAGHRRSEYRPPTPGLPWGFGAVSEAVWAGCSLANVLDAVGTQGRYVLLQGADHGSFRDTAKVAFARALPSEKACHPDTLLAWEMNGRPVPHAHGGPVRAIVPGWYATDSVKWLKRITVLDYAFDGPFETVDYRKRVNASDAGSRLTTLSAHSLITSVADGEQVPAGEQILRGIAWGETADLIKVEVSIDNDNWQQAELAPMTNLYGRRHWAFAWHAKPGIHTVAVRATDAGGNSQPRIPAWNEGGYANNSIQRILLTCRRTDGLNGTCR
ncbi:MAG TPA: sulfite oxidase [Gaiellaceae bacterium]